jgi:hypothetical protein
MVSQSISIDKAKQKFADWRKNKSAGDRIPEHLWDMVGNMLASASYNKSFFKALGISSVQLKSKFPKHFAAKIYAPSRTSAPVKTKFVQSSLAPLLISRLNIEQVNGAKLTLSAPSTEQLTVIVKLFIEHA